MTNVKSRLDFSAFLRTQEIENQLQDAVMSGELADGFTVELKSLAELFEVEKSHMLAMLYDLIELGFFTGDKHSGKFTARYNSIEAADLGQVRLTTEKNTLVTALRDIAAIDVGLCHKRLNIFENNVGTAKGFCEHLDVFGTVYFGREFDLRITKTEKNLWKYCKYLRLLWSDTKQLEIYCKGLRRFLELCDRGQGKVAQEAMLEHITETGDYIVTRLTAIASKSSDQNLSYAPAQQF